MITRRVDTWNSISLAFLTAGVFCVAYAIGTGNAVLGNIAGMFVVIGVAGLAFTLQLERRHKDALLAEENSEIGAELEQDIDKLNLHPAHVVLLPMKPSEVEPFKAPGAVDEWEMVRTYSIRPNTTHVAIYESAPTSAIVAVGVIASIVNDTPELARLHGRPLPDYALGARRFARIALNHLVFIQPPIDINEIDLMSAPQSARYLKPDQALALATAVGDIKLGGAK